MEAAEIGHSPQDPLTEEFLNIGYPHPGSTFRLKVGINVPELLDISTSALGKQTRPSIRNFSHGTFNKLFLLTFEDGTELVARCPFPEDYHELQMRSEISTILFARHHCHLPVPRIYAWSVVHDCSVSAPFMLLERLPGESISERRWFRELDQTQQLKVLDAVASLHVKLVQALPPSITRVGNIFLRDFPNVCDKWEDSAVSLEEFEIGPFIRSHIYRKDEHLADVPMPTTSFKTMADYWTAAAQLQFLAGRERWKRLTTPYIVSEDDFFMDYQPQTILDFADVYRNLMAILGHYARVYPPTRIDQQLCLWNHDFSLRNVLFDPSTFQVTGIVDWEDASIVPLVLAARSPDELERQVAMDDEHEWTYAPNELFVCTIPKGHEGRFDMEETIDTTWHRIYYSGQVALGDVRFDTHLWRDHTRALKLQELLAKGWFFWLQKKTWIEATAASLSCSKVSQPEEARGDQVSLVRK